MPTRAFITRIPALRLGLTIYLANAKDAAASEILSLEFAWTAAKVIFACSPILAIAAVLAFAKEDNETEDAKRKIKCNRS